MEGWEWMHEVPGSPDRKGTGAEETKRWSCAAKSSAKQVHVWAVQGSGKQHLTSSQEIYLFLIKSSKSELSKWEKAKWARDTYAEGFQEAIEEKTEFSGKAKCRRTIFFSCAKDKGTSVWGLSSLPTSFGLQSTRRHLHPSPQRQSSWWSASEMGQGHCGTAPCRLAWDRM